MKIESLQPEGFGHFAGQVIAPFDAPLTVIYGPNEAGKSTLLAFVRTMLFGFPQRDRASHYPALNGGRHGGRITLRAADGSRYVVERFENSGTPSLRITLPDGAQSDDEAVLARLLGNSTRSLFEAVFAFGLLDLQAFESLQKGEAAQQIYAAGMGAADLPRIQQALSTAADNLFKPRGQNQEAAQLAARLKQIDDELDRLRGESLEYAEKTAACERLESEIARLAAEADLARTQLAEADVLARAWQDWIARDDLRARLAAMPGFEGFPDDAILRLDHLLDAVDESRRVCDRLAREVAALQERSQVPVPGEELLAASALADDVRRQRGSLENSITDLPRRQGEFAEQSRQLAEEIRSLGPGWNEARVRAFDTSLPVQERVATWQRNLDDAARDLHDAELRDRMAADALRDASERVAAAVDDLARLPLPSLTREDAGARQDLLRTARSRLSLVAAAANRRESLEAQKVLLGAAAPVPARAGSSSLAALFAVGGAAATAGGLLAGPPVLLLALLGGFILFGVAAWLLLGQRRAQSPAAPSEVPGLANAIDEEARLRSELEAIALRLGVTADTDALDAFDRRLTEVRSALADVQAAEERLAARRAEQREAGRKCEVTARALEEASTRCSSHGEQWRQWLAKVGLAGTLPPDRVLVLIERTAGLQAKLRALDSLADRIDKIKADIDRETGRVAEFARAGGRALGPADSAAILRTADNLLAAFESAAEGVRERNRLLDDLAARRDELCDAQRRLDDNTRRLDGLLAAGAASDPESFRARAAQFAERCRLESALATAEQRLRALSGPAAEFDRLCARLEATNAAEIARSRESAAARIRQSEAAVAGAREELGAVRARLELLATSTRASQLRAERAVALEQLRDIAEQWSRLTIARNLLDRARTKFERERQPAVIQSASAYFRAITRGRYERLAVPIGAQAIQAFPAGDGAPRSPHQLSQGTQEQLYLAMRFGLVEHFARQATALPVVVDEVLVNFDPERALAAACGFSRLARNHQVVVFTCHPWVVETFRNADPMTHVIELDPVESAPRLFAATAAR